MLLEVIATNLADAIAADQSGADRIELVTGMLEGGLTPSIGFIEEPEARYYSGHPWCARTACLFIMIRYDIQTMVADIRQIRKTGAKGIVIGALTQERRVNSLLQILTCRGGRAGM